MTLAPGQTVGGYQIIEQIGRGGMATVFKAYQTRLSRFVAIKVLPAFYAEDQTFRERFQNEAQAIARLRHPNILAVYDYGEDEGVPYIVTELVSGGTLSSLLGTPLSPAQALKLLRPIASALDYSHAHGIIHRDIKPSNVLLDEDGRPVLADFGVAFILANTDRLTATGFTVGTPAYMAPEQAGGGQLSTATDVYALTVVLYEMLTGGVPFTGDSPVTIAIAHLQTPPPPPRSRAPGITDAVQSVVLAGLAKLPEDRYQSAGDLVAALQTASTVPGEAFDAAASTIIGPVSGETPVAPDSTPDVAVTTPMPTDPMMREGGVQPVRMVPWIAAVVVIVAVAAGFFLSRQGAPQPVPEPTPVAPVAVSIQASVPSPVGSALPPSGVWQVFGASRTFNQPSSVAVDSLGRVYVEDTFGHQVWKFSPNGEELGHWGSQGTDAGQFRTPFGLAVNQRGEIYIADTNNNRVEAFGTDGRFVAEWGKEGNRPGEFEQPHGLAVAAGGRVYVSDTGNDRIQVLSATGQPLAQFGRPGTGPAQFNGPRGLALDDQGDLYVADTNNHRIQKLSRDGQPLAMWGGEGDGSAQFRFPQAVALDSQGNIYVADSRNHRVLRLTPQGAYSATWGGTGSAPGQFSSPQGLAIDHQGMLYVADTDNNRVQRVNLGIR